MQQRRHAHLGALLAEPHLLPSRGLDAVGVHVELCSSKRGGCLCRVSASQPHAGRPANTPPPLALPRTADALPPEKGAQARERGGATKHLRPGGVGWGGVVGVGWGGGCCTSCGAGGGDTGPQAVPAAAAALPPRTRALAARAPAGRPRPAQGCTPQVQAAAREEPPPQRWTGACDAEPAPSTARPPPPRIPPTPTRCPRTWHCAWWPGARRCGRALPSSGGSKSAGAIPPPLRLAGPPRRPSVAASNADRGAPSDAGGPALGLVWREMGTSQGACTSVRGSAAACYRCTQNSRGRVKRPARLWWGAAARWRFPSTPSSPSALLLHSAWAVRTLRPALGLRTYGVRTGMHAGNAGVGAKAARIASGEGRACIQPDHPPPTHHGGVMSGGGHAAGAAGLKSAQVDTSAPGRAARGWCVCVRARWGGGQRTGSSSTSSSKGRRTAPQH